MPNGRTIGATHYALLNLPQFLPESRKAHIFLHLQSGTLLSIGNLCNDGCTTILTAQFIIVSKKNTIIINSNGNQDTELWDIDILDVPYDTLPVPEMNNTLEN